MEMKRLICGAAVCFLLSLAPALASPITVYDAHNYWNGWHGQPGYGYNDDSLDVIGEPNFTKAEVNYYGSGSLQSIKFFYSNGPADQTALLLPGDLFLMNHGSTGWNYVARSYGTMNAGSIGLYDVHDLSLTKGTTVSDGSGLFTNGSYILSGFDVTGYWNGCVIRDEHPMAVTARTLDDLVGNVGYTGFVGGAGDRSTTFTFADGNPIGAGFTFSWQPNCANDVFIEQTPVPEPGSMVLLTTGLFGLAAFGRRRAISRKA
jgi:hypothetical protein